MWSCARSGTSGSCEVQVSVVLHDTQVKVSGAAELDIP